jgi:hypothetical protein
VPLRRPRHLVRILPLVGIVAALALGGCSNEDEVTGSAREASTTSPTATSSQSAPLRLTPEQVVQKPGSELKLVWVERTGAELAVDAVWGPPGRRGDAVASSHDGFATTTHARYRWSSSAKQFPQWSTPTHPALPELEGLLQDEIPSLARGLRAVIGGGDGATLFPFQAVARSADDGSTWRRTDVPRFDGETAYTSGAVVLPDGRLLVLLQDFSDDRLRHPAQRHHGLWVSDGDDWSSYRPWRPRFRPALTPPVADGAFSGNQGIDMIGASGARGGVIWTVSGHDRVHVSTDGARTFVQIPAR